MIRFAPNAAISMKTHAMCYCHKRGLPPGARISSRGRQIQRLGRRHASRTTAPRCEVSISGAILYLRRHHTSMSEFDCLPPLPWEACTDSNRRFHTRTEESATQVRRGGVEPLIKPCRDCNPVRARIGRVRSNLLDARLVQLLILASLRVVHPQASSPSFKGALRQSSPKVARSAGYPHVPPCCRTPHCVPAARRPRAFQLTKCVKYSCPCSNGTPTFDFSIWSVSNYIRPNSPWVSASPLYRQYPLGKPEKSNHSTGSKWLPH
jgi:hypothetical protein